MKAWHRCGAAAVVAILAGCFSYVPAELATVPDGQEVRIFLTRAGVARLAELGVIDLLPEGDPVVAGVLMRRVDGRLALRIPISAPVAAVARDIVQEIPIDAADILRIDTQRLARGRTVLAAAGAVGAAAATTVLIIRGSEGEPRLPFPGGPDDVRIPLLRGGP